MARGHRPRSGRRFWTNLDEYITIGTEVKRGEVEVRLEVCNIETQYSYTKRTLHFSFFSPSRLISMASNFVLSFTASGHPYTSSKGAPSFCRSSFLPDTVSLCVDDESSSVSHRSPEVLFPYFRVWPFSPTVSPHVRDHRSPPAPTLHVSPTFFELLPSRRNRSSHLSPHRVPTPFSAHLSVHLIALAFGEPAGSRCFCKNKSVSHVLGVYWTCIGRCMNNSHRNRSEQS